MDPEAQKQVDLVGPDPVGPDPVVRSGCGWNTMANLEGNAWVVDDPVVVDVRQGDAVGCWNNNPFFT